MPSSDSDYAAITEPIDAFYIIMHAVVTAHLTAPPAMRLARTLNTHEISAALQTLHITNRNYCLAQTARDGSLMYYYHHTNGNYYTVIFNSVVSVDNVTSVSRDYSRVLL
jgi:hypothetical protein